MKFPKHIANRTKCPRGRVFETPDLNSTVLLLVTAQFISELLIKLSTVV